MIGFNESLQSIEKTGALHVHRSWRQGRGVFGGLIGGAFVKMFADKASGLEDSDSLKLRSLKLQLRAPLPEGPVPLHTNIDRAGKYVAYLDGSMGENEKLVEATAVMARPTGVGLHVQNEEPPQVPVVEDIEPWPKLEIMPRFTRYFEYRACIGNMPFSGNKENPEIGGWIRFCDQDPMNLPRLAAIVDAWPLSAMVAANRVSPAASVDICYQFWGEPNPDDQWLLVRNQTNVIRDGYADQCTSVWAPSGKLLVSAHQLTILLTP